MQNATSYLRIYILAKLRIYKYNLLSIFYDKRCFQLILLITKAVKLRGFPLDNIMRCFPFSFTDKLQSLPIYKTFGS